MSVDIAGDDRHADRRIKHFPEPLDRRDQRRGADGDTLFQFSVRLSERALRVSPVRIEAVERPRGEPDQRGEDHHVRQEGEHEAEVHVKPAGVLTQLAEPAQYKRQRDRERQETATHQSAAMFTGDYTHQSLAWPGENRSGAEDDKEPGRVHGHGCVARQPIQRKCLVNIPEQRRHADEGRQQSESLRGPAVPCRRARQDLRRTEKHKGQGGGWSHSSRQGFRPGETVMDEPLVDADLPPGPFFAKSHRADEDNQARAKTPETPERSRDRSDHPVFPQ